MKASIIVLAYGNVVHTRRCIDAVARTAPDAELIVIDNGSTAEVPGAVVNAENVGFARGCNQGARLATGDVLVFLNNDATPRQGWLEALLVPFEDDTVGMTGATLRYPDGTVQAAGITIDFDRPYGNEARNANLPPGDVQGVTGACMAVRRLTFQRVGGFDEGFWNGYEDVDLCLKVDEDGWRIVLTDADVEHIESASGPERWTGVHRNIARLRTKWM